MTDSHPAGDPRPNPLQASGEPVDSPEELAGAESAANFHRQGGAPEPERSGSQNQGSDTRQVREEIPPPASPEQAPLRPSKVGRPQGTKDKLLWLWLTCLGLGAIPAAPGTFGTIGGVVLGLGAQATWTAEGGTEPVYLGAILVGLGVVITLLSWPLGPAIGRMYGTADPGGVVIDEVAGYLVALGIACLATDTPPGPWTHAAVFVLFRLFDILKWPFIWRLQAIPGAAGVLLDDIAAGVWAGAVMLAVAPALPV